MTKNLIELAQKASSFKGISADSREVKDGFIFVAVKGEVADGHDFIKEAVKNGATAIVGEKDIKAPNYIKVPDSREALGTLSSAFFRNPASKLTVIGVTGTKGKTTTVHMIYHILSSLGKKVGMISSITAKIGDKEIDTGFHVTSPDVVSLNRFLKLMVDAGCEFAVIEVSSHGITQKRIAGVGFDVAVLTNIAPEHLDYHKTFGEYKRTKMSFMESAEIRIFSKDDTDIDLFPGKFNDIDAQTAIDTVTSLGFNREEALSSLKTFKLPEGRLEEYTSKEGYGIVIDFAHTPNSLEAVTSYLKGKKKGKLISVFGCAGERDRKKRFQMGKISAKYANFSVFTAEDPRSEDVHKIIAKMVEGAKSTGAKEERNFVSVPLRGEAIAAALSKAKEGDIVGFFGKGHEKSMAYKGFEHPWSDRRAVDNFIARDKRLSAVILAAGKGTRMGSVRPKILSEICGRPLISYTLTNLREAKVGEIIAVVSYRKREVIREINGAVKFAVQKNPKGGTANAVLSALPKVSFDAQEVMVLYGDDTAFYTPETISEVIKKHFESHSTLTFVTLTKDNPTGLGRIIRDKDGEVEGIVEEKDATLEQRKIKEVNDGLYIFKKDWLKKNLPNVKKSSVTKEYYLVELIKTAIDQKEKVTAYKLPDDREWQGVNTPEELARAEEKMKEKLKNYHG
ncbi:MAG TPA: Mur ligase family protein [Patescibacteria group bacterium]|nr:Mur ligase family protein [Patescibacteria group bacterium]